MTSNFSRHPFKGDNDAIRISNDSKYGLSGALKSGDRDGASRLAQSIISINGGKTIAVELPFGGYKHNGFGKK